MISNKDVYLSASQVAQALGITKQDVYRLEAAGKLVGFRAAPNDSRAVFSMREVNRLKEQKLF